MSIEIRKMEKDDWGEMVEIYFQAITSNMDTFEYTCPSVDDWDKTHFPFARMIAEDDCEVAGWAAIEPFSDRECYKGVAEIAAYVDSNHKNHGVGEALLKATVDEAVKMGIWSIQAHLLQENTAAVSLYEKCGFRKVGVSERLGKDRFGVWRSVVIMEYRIQTDKAGGCDCALAHQQREV